MTASKLDSLIEESGINLLDHISDYDLKDFARQIIEECCLIIDSAVYHKLPTESFSKLLKEELL